MTSELYEYTDPQDCQLVVKRAPSGAHLAVFAYDLSYGGESVNVWLTAEEARTFTDSLASQSAFECTDHMGDALAMSAPAEDWTVFTFTRCPRDDDDSTASVRVVVLTARLPVLGAAVAAGADQIQAAQMKEA